MAFSRTDQPSRPEQTPESAILRRLRVRWAAIGAAIAVTLGAGTITTVDAIKNSGERLVYVAGEPCRLMNTRPGPNQVGPRTTPLPAGTPVVVQARGDQGNCDASQLPDDAVALQLNVTPVNATASTDITIWPSGPIPQASSVNPRPGPPVPNAVTATLASDGTFRMQNKNGTIDMVIDVLGYYVDHRHDDRYGNPRVIDVGIYDLFEAVGTTWDLNGFGWWEKAAGNACLQTRDLGAVPGQRFQSVEFAARNIGVSNTTATVSVFSIDTRPGTTSPISRSETALFEIVSVAPGSLEYIGIGTDDVPVTGDDTVRSGSDYFARICSSGELQLVGVRVRLTNP